MLQVAGTPTSAQRSHRWLAPSPGKHHYHRRRGRKDLSYVGEQ